MTISEQTILRLVEAATRVVGSADDTGRSDDLTVVSKDAVDNLANVLLEIEE